MTIDEVYDTARRFMPARIVLTGIELDIFGAVGGAPKAGIAADDVARGLSLDPRGTRILLDALVSMGLLAKLEDLYRNSETAARHLDPAAPEFKGWGLRHVAALWESWNALTEVVKTGKHHEREITEDTRERFIRAMADSGMESAPRLVEMIDLSKCRSLLDLGGGPGHYAVGFCREFPALRATIFDLPHATEIADERIAEAGLGDRIDTHPGDFIGDDVPKGFDAVLVSHIIHARGEADNQMILRKAADALEQGGIMIIHDFFLEDDMAHPVGAAQFAVNMLVNTEAGRTYTANEVEAWLVSLGFSDFGFCEVTERSQALTARKGAKQ